ncbi:hypothetical protein AMAG_07281 [Allomyces macrogynus ATCC 38327]|uniref:UspA domain-containing protein n=1 Tax=Allomyces macrogynus (strain ATCC 38327) TaxID=578462 RepID=A0A0L0SHN6_ALLM3|nr:hypothetical protein AMAG_07281 [Allomyces macrogynus ATCC 38327]|eukprot:KNE62023.1 hypothetical protein AMAG_07281 [Allomyces macrogynus ATCC 38327]
MMDDSALAAAAAGATAPRVFDPLAPYVVLTAVDASAPSWHAVDFAANLVAHLSNYRLLVVYVTALNRTSRFPYLDHLDKAYNLEIQHEAKSAIQECQAYLHRFDDNVSYELIEIEGEGEVGPLLEKYIDEHVPDCNLVVLGTHGHQGLKKMLYGSVSEYCITHLRVPVTVVKAPAGATTAGSTRRSSLSASSAPNLTDRPS